jgi:environmental stress-induced protein Ves
MRWRNPNDFAVIPWVNATGRKLDVAIVGDP